MLAYVLIVYLAAKLNSMFDVIQHHFSANLYAKHMVIKDGCEVSSHKHSFDHLSILAQGCVILEVDGEQSTHYAPAVIEIKAGLEHKITAVNGDCTWFCIHGVTDADEQTIDDVLIQKVVK